MVLAARWRERLASLANELGTSLRSERPARLGAFCTGCDQQLRHALVHAILRGCPFNGGPVELHTVRRAVPMRRRLCWNKSTRLGKGLCCLVGYPAGTEVGLDGTAVRSSVCLGHHGSRRRIIPDQVWDRLGFGLMGRLALRCRGTVRDRRGGLRTGRLLWLAARAPAARRLGRTGLGSFSSGIVHGRVADAGRGGRPERKRGRLRLAAPACRTGSFVRLGGFRRGNGRGGVRTGLGLRLAGHAWFSSVTTA